MPPARPRRGEPPVAGRAKRGRAVPRGRGAARRGSAGTAGGTLPAPAIVGPSSASSRRDGGRISALAPSCAGVACWQRGGAGGGAGDALHHGERTAAAPGVSSLQPRGACAPPCTYPAPVPPMFWAGARGGDVRMGIVLDPRAVCAMGSRIAVHCSSLAGVGLPLHRSPRPWGLSCSGWAGPRAGGSSLPAERGLAPRGGGCVALACAAPGGAGCLWGLRGCTPGGPQLRCLLSLPAAPGEGPDALPQAAERADRPQLPEASPGEGGTGHARGGGAPTGTPAAGLRRGPCPLQLARLAAGR